MAKVVGVCISEKKGEIKHEVSEICVRKNWGIDGDAHAGDWHRQISLLAKESVDRMRKIIPDLEVGVFAENIHTEGIVLYELPIGTRLQVGNALLEITQIGKECHAHCAIRQKTGDCVMPREGVFAIVIEEGTIYPGDNIEIVK